MRETKLRSSLRGTNSNGRRPKLAVLTNVVAPYRLPIFERLGEVFDTVVLYSAHEANRSTWKDVPAQMSNCRRRRAWGWTLTTRRRDGDAVFNERYLHINPGYLVDLIREQPDAIITAELGFRTVVALSYARLFRKPLWIWWGGTNHTERNVSGRKLRLRRWIVRQAPRWISYGESSTRYLLALGAPRERILQIQNCVDESRFRPDGEPLCRISPRPVLLCVGHLIGLKGVDLLLEAAARVQARGEEFSLLVVGDGPEEENLRRLAERLELRNVHFMPSQQPEAMAGVYRSGDVLVFPSLQDVWGLAVNEAMLCGRPALCSIHAGCAEELVSPEDQFDPTDARQFDEVLTRAVRGQISPADTSRPRTCRSVADAIVADVQGVLKDRRRPAAAVSQHNCGVV